MSRIGFSWKGTERLIKALQQKSEIDWLNVRNKSLVEMRDRAVRTKVPTRGGTPRDTGELRLSVGVNPKTGEVGYTKEYAPHVEFGHRTARGNGYVHGQHFLKNNMRIQEPKLRKDLRDVLDD